MLEVFKRVDRQWLQSQVFDGNRAERVRAEPFDAVELDLQRWWLAE